MDPGEHLGGGGDLDVEPDVSVECDEQLRDFVGEGRHPVSDRLVVGDDRLHRRLVQPDLEHEVVGGTVGVGATLGHPADHAQPRAQVVVDLVR